MRIDINVSINSAWAKDQRDRIAHSAMMAARTIGAQTKSRARAKIASSGMPGNMQNALRVEVYPKGKDATTPAMTVRHNAAYSNIFEGPGETTISAKHLLWIPLPSAKKLLPRNRSGMSAKTEHYVRDVGAKVGGFVYVPGRGGRPPLLCARYDVGAKGKIRKAYKAKAKRTQGQITPLFFGVPSVAIAGRWRLAEIVRSEWSKMKSLYAAGLRS